MYKKNNHRDCALIVTPIVTPSACTFYMKFLWVFLGCLLCMKGKLVSDLENERQLIRFRVYGKSATNAQMDGGG